MSKTKHARPRKAARRDTTIVYVRIRRTLHTRLRELADSRGYPHSISSVAGEALEQGLDKLAPIPEAPNVGEVGHGG